MSYPISMFVARLQASGHNVISGCYTPATVAQLALSLGRLAFSDAKSILLVADSDPQHIWAELPLRGIEVPVQQIVLPTESTKEQGFALIGIGQTLGFAIAAIPTDAIALDESMRLHDVVWSCDPQSFLALSGLIGEYVPASVITQLRMLQALQPEDLLQINGELLDFMARQHSTLAVAARALTERMRNHEDQTRMVVHDMRAPLHTLLISIKALQRQRFEPDGQNELLTVARDSANYLLNLTETVLDSARLETSGWSLQRQPVRLLSLAQSVCDPLQLAARPDQAKLRHYVAEDLPIIWVDRALIERVLTNLITNAIKYTPPSGEISITARLIHDGHSVELKVSDTGQGIPPEAQAHIFERFYQANESDYQRGTGLGLYFCRLAIEAHGGSIAVQSIVGQGSTFTILLPIADEESRQNT